MKKNSIARKNIGLQEFEETVEESHSYETVEDVFRKTVTTFKREHVYVENFDKLYRKITTETITKYILKDDNNPSGKKKGDYERDVEKKKNDNIKVVCETEEDVEEFDLREIPKEKLQILRSQQIPVFILKENNRYYFAFVPYNFKLTGSVKIEHRCAPRTTICKRLSPKADCDGGCRKVRAAKKRLESFSWIKSGYETINTEFESFLVIKCEHQDLLEDADKYAKVPGEKMLELSSFLWNDVDNVNQMIKRINRKIKKG